MVFGSIVQMDPRKSIYTSHSVILGNMNMMNSKSVSGMKRMLHAQMVKLKWMMNIVAHHVQNLPSIKATVELVSLISVLIQKKCCGMEHVKHVLNLRNQEQKEPRYIAM